VPTLKIRSNTANDNLLAKLERLRTDPRFAIENTFKIKGYGMRDMVPLRFNEAQMRLYEAHQYFRERRMPVRIIVVKARRVGLSTGVESLLFHDTITNPLTNSLIVTHMLKPSTNVLNMCVRFWQGLPEYVVQEINGKPEKLQFRPRLLKKYNEIPSSDLLEFDVPLLSNVHVCSAKSYDAYLSWDFQNIHFSEASRFDNAEEAFRSLMPTLGDSDHTAVYIESTAAGQSGKGEWFYEQALDASLRTRMRRGEMKLVFVPWHEMRKSFAIPFESDDERQEFQRDLKGDERDIIKQFPHVTLEQMKWYVAKHNEPPYNKRPELFLQEYPGTLTEAFLASGESVFSIPALTRLSARIKEPKWRGDVYWGDSDAQNRFISTYDAVRRPKFRSPAEARADGFAAHDAEKTAECLQVWRWPNSGERLVIGADVGAGNPLSPDGDYSTACVLATSDFGRDELIMTWRGKINTIAFGEVLAALAWGCIGMVGSNGYVILAPEWTGPGTATCTSIDHNMLYTLWHYRIPGTSGTPQSKHIGWESNLKTKPFAVNTMVRAVETDTVNIYSQELVMEMSAYRQLSRQDEEYGGVNRHDDLVSSFQIACAVAKLEGALLGADWEPRTIDLDVPTPTDSRREPFDPFEQPEGTPYDYGDEEEETEDMFYAL
jgi:hypothetical protein